MTEPADDPAPLEPQGCGPAMLAMVAATVPVAAGLAVIVFWPSAFLAVLIASLALVGLIGGPAYLIIRKQLSVARVAGAGFVTGAFWPIVVLLFEPYAALDTDDLLETGAYGLAGVAAALVSWALLTWQRHDDRAEKVLVGAMVLGIPALALLL